MMAARDDQILMYLAGRADWKTPREIAKECDLFDVVATYFSLDRLEKKGLIKGRWRDISEERLRNRGGNRLREYAVNK